MFHKEGTQSILFGSIFVAVVLLLTDNFIDTNWIKMVIQMAKADFNPIRTKRYTDDLRAELGKVTLAGSGENIEIEIIPFEVLWEVMNRAL